MDGRLGAIFTLKSTRRLNRPSFGCTAVRIAKIFVRIRRAANQQSAYKYGARRNWHIDYLKKTYAPSPELKSELIRLKAGQKEIQIQQAELKRIEEGEHAELKRLKGCYVR